MKWLSSLIIREFKYSSIVRETKMLNIISTIPPSLQRFLENFKDLFIKPQFENFKVYSFGLQLELKRTNIQTIDECRVNGLHPCDWTD